MNSLVSVIMPAKNAGKFIKQSIESILNQSYQDIELIVINDKSTDDTLSIIKQFDDERISVIEGNSTGISDAFNLGLKHAQGEFFCRCDADDLYPFDRIASQVKWLRDNPDYIAVCGKYSTIDEKSRHLVQYLRGVQDQNIDDEFKLLKTITHFCTFMTHTSILRNIGGCRPFFVTGEDIDLQLRLSMEGKIFFLAQNFYYYRLHNISITHIQPNSKREFYEAIARKCHEQRQSGVKDSVDSGENLTPPEIGDKARKSENKIINQMISQSWYWHKNYQRKKAIYEAFRIVKFFPTSLLSWKNLLTIIMKK